MAPTRRKGASKAAATAAACRQWKVGDLVLAKVKGFPAWPATVSEPEKWGYTTDWKKVLVYFFGTQQIAFCNPADVEAFTEEKKNSLLIRPQGKGSDFVRAVHEIIDSYEKLKSQDQGINVHSLDDVTVTNASKAVESLTDSGLNDEARDVTVKSRPKTSNSTRTKKGSGAAIQKDALHGKETPSEEPTEIMEMPLQTTYSRKKFGGIHAQNFVTQKRAPSARRSRISSRVDSSRFQNFILPSSNIGKSAGNGSSSVLRDGSLRRNKRIRKSPDVSEENNVDVSAFVSNGSLEENGSEIVTVDSDTLSFEEGSTVESGYNLLQLEPVVESCEGDVKLSQRLDFQGKSVVVKKKRKPSRKRASNGATELTSRVDKDTCLEIEVPKTEKISPRDHENLDRKYSKEDGDEHLPLVKRARVRMGRPSSAGEELDALIKTEEKSSEVSNSCLVQLCSALNCEEDSPVDGSSSVVKGNLEISSPSNKCPMNKPPLWEVKKHQQLGCSLDGEAALPPSKRIHRALEAMSANAAEDGQTSLEAPSTVKIFNNGSFTRECSKMYLENRTKIEIEVRNVDSLNNNVSQHPTAGSSAGLNLPVGDESTKSFVQVAACNSPVKINNPPEQVFCKDVLVEAVDCADERNPSASSLDTHMDETVVLGQSPKPSSPTLGRKQDYLGCNQGLVGMILPSNDVKIENPGSSKPCKEDDPSQPSRASSDPVSDDMEIAIQSPQNDTNLLLSGAQNNCEITKLLKFPSGENNKENGMCEVVKETRPILKDSNAAPTPITEEIMPVAVQGAHISNPSSLSEDLLSHKAVSGIRSSSSPTDGLDSTPRASPPSTSIPNMSTSDTSNLIENNGCCSPDAHVHHEKPKHASKLSNRGEASAALASFEANLGTLTRTKESIGRATRIAIDCAKFGNATKVVQIIACNLEKEPSLHRRVDLFFLVDSITQCSRGFKGNVGGGVYPSVIQAVLPRLLLAAAPPGSSALENRRQCLKVLRLWQDRKILPESVIRRHIRDLDSLSNSSSTGAFSRRPMRTERAFDDPLREMEGVVDEYGSNSSFQLPGFRMPPMLKDEDQKSDSDGESFEAVTPEHNSENPEERGWAPTPAVEKRRHILEDVDGELEMEDVAPPCEAEMSSTANVPVINTAEILHNHQFEKHYPIPFAPPLPKDVPPLSTPPLPTSPPPPPPPVPSLPPPAMLDPFTSGVDSKLYVSKHNIKDDPLQSAAQQSVAPRINPTIMEPANNHAPQSHPPIRAVNSVQQADGAALHNTAFHLRPPHPAPSNQFSYVQADHQLQPRMDAPPQSYPPNRFHFVQNTDNGNFYGDQDRMKLAPHEIGESWRFSAPLSGPCYPDSGRVSFAPVPYTGIPCEPTIPNPSWAFPPRGMNHRELIPHRPPSDGPVPVATRAPNFWRPR